MSTIRLTLIMSHFQAGGAERVMSILANHWVENGWNIHILTPNGRGEQPFYPLHPNIYWQDLNLSKPLGNPFKAIFRLQIRLRQLRAAIKGTSPDVVLSFNDEMNVITLLAMVGLSIPIVVSERNDPHCHIMKKPWRWIRPWAYQQAASVVVQTQHALTYFSKPIRERARVIPNPVAKPPESGRRLDIKTHQQGLVIMAMGRLHQQKGFDLLIRAFAQISRKHPSCILQIWGEGEERCKLEKLIAKLNHESRINLMGVTKASYEQMRQADIFVLSSRYEGFPNVLCEAMACGLPVVSFNCHSGPAEIIRDGIDGILVPAENVNALANTLDRLLSDELQRLQLGSHASQAIERFGLENIVGEWSNIMLGITGKQSTPQGMDNDGRDRNVGWFI